jgi:dolichyl-phosphate beta-glucosyltransferase
MLSIILPAYQASVTLQNQLPAFLQFLRDWDYPSEVIVVDDGSPDQKATRQVAEDLGVTFLSYPLNKGKGAAVKMGVQHAKGDFILFTDVDIPFHYQAFPQFLEELQVRKGDIAIGDRTLAESTYFSQISPLRKIGSDIFSSLVGRFVTTGVYDTQCGMKAFTREAAMEVFGHSRIQGFAFDVEILFLAKQKGYRVKQLPVLFRCNEGSSVRVLKHGILMITDLLKILFFHFSGKYR